MLNSIFAVFGCNSVCSPNKILFLRLLRLIYSDCIAAVKKITRRWTPGKAFQDAGAALVMAARALLSTTISVQWTKSHPERSDSPPTHGPGSSGAYTWRTLYHRTRISVHFRTLPYQFCGSTRSLFMTYSPRSPR